MDFQENPGDCRRINMYVHKRLASDADWTASVECPVRCRSVRNIVSSLCTRSSCGVSCGLGYRWPSSGPYAPCCHASACHPLPLSGWQVSWGYNCSLLHALGCYRHHSA